MINYNLFVSNIPKIMEGVRVIEKKNFISLEETAISQNKENKKKLYVCWGIYFLISTAFLFPLVYYIYNTLTFSINVSAWSGLSHITIAEILKTTLPLIPYFLITPVLNYNLTKIHLKISKGEKINYSDFFKITNNFKKYCKLVLMHFIKQILMFFTVFIPAGISICFEIIHRYTHFSDWWLLLVYPVLIVTSLAISALIILKIIPISMAYYILIDNPNITIRETISKSKNIIKNHNKEIFKLYLSYFWGTLLIAFSIIFCYAFWIFVLLIIPLSFLAVPGDIIKNFIIMPKFKTVTANYYNQLKD